MKDFGLLSENDIFNRRLNIFEFYPKEAYLTDFALLLGGVPTEKENQGNPYHGYWWLSDVNTTFLKTSNKVSCIGKDGELTSATISVDRIGIRPSVKYSSIKPYTSMERVIMPGLKEVCFGEYPTLAVPQRLNMELEEKFLKISQTIKAAKKSYTVGNGLKDKNFALTSFPAYEYNGKKYIRCFPQKLSSLNKLHDGRAIDIDRAYWVSVEPVEWLVDEDNDIALSKHLLLSGIPFDTKNSKDYEGSFMKEFMDNYFSKDIEGIITKYNEQGKLIEKKINNTYGFDTSLASEEDIIKGAILSDVSVFIHGKSSDGKSARVKELDPDCEIIYMRNATPDSLNGKSVYDASTGEMIDVPPSWYTKVVEKCNNEPNKIHIVFFDELTNALPSMQGMAFNIILDREVNGKWKLPKNARIVAAGNDLQDSLAANKMAEPLFNRFAHVYIRTEVEDWLKWAKAPKKKYERLDYVESKTSRMIHPAVIAYIRYKSTSGQDVLRTPFTGEKPNADPRKWEMASKILYKTGRPDMLRALIGEPLTKDFIEFVRRQLITVEDVINHNYSEEDFQMDLSEKFTVAAGLSSVDEEHFEEVRDFVGKLGPEVRTTFETMWAGIDEKRLEKVAEAKLADKVKKL